MIVTHTQETPLIETTVWSVNTASPDKREFKCVEYRMHPRGASDVKGSTHLVMQTGPCDPRCQREGLDPERQMTDSLVVMTIGLSLMPRANMR